MPSEGPMLLAVLFSLWMATTSGIEISFIPQYPVRNQTVVLSVTGVPGRIRYSAWYRGNSSDASQQILRHNADGSETRGLRYFQGASGHTNGSLQIPSLQKELEGNYTVEVHDETDLYRKTVLLEAKEVPKASEGLSGGAIAGICIGSAAAALLIGGVIYMFTKKGSQGPL